MANGVVNVNKMVGGDFWEFLGGRYVGFCLRVYRKYCGV